MRLTIAVLVLVWLPAAVAAQSRHAGAPLGVPLPLPQIGFPLPSIGLPRPSIGFPGRLIVSPASRRLVRCGTSGTGLGDLARSRALPRSSM